PARPASTARRVKRCTGCLSRWKGAEAPGVAGIRIVAFSPMREGIKEGGIGSLKRRPADAVAGSGKTRVGLELRGDFDGQACSRAFAKSLTLAKRCCGFFASALITTSSTYGGTPGTLSRSGGGGAYICWLYNSVKFPLNGQSPHIHS